MLYPIELLRHKSSAKECEAMDGVHVNGQARFCHVVRGLFKCRQTPQKQEDIVYRANCITAKRHHCKMQCVHFLKIS